MAYDSRMSLKHFAVFLFSASALIGQTTISASQVSCPVSSMTLVAIAIPSAQPPGAKTMRMVCAALDPSLFVIDTSTKPPTLRLNIPAQPQPQYITEAATGAIDGTNATFAPSAAPVDGTLQVFLNGLLQANTADYVVNAVAAPSGTTSTVTFKEPPQPGDSVQLSYRKK